MTESPGLHDLFERATDAIASPALAATALQGARRRRTRRRGLAAAAASSALVAAVVVATTVGGGSSVTPRADPSASTPTTTPDVVDQPIWTPPEADFLTESDVQASWDPDDVADLPFTDLMLPSDLSPGPDSGPDTIRTLAVAWDADGLWLLDDGERWGRVAYPDDTHEAVAISADGTRVAVLGGDALWWRDTERGTWMSVPHPGGFQDGSEYGLSLDFVGTDRLLVGEYARSWVVDLGDGQATPLPFDIYDEVVPAGDDVLANRFADTRPVSRRIERWSDGVVVDLGDPFALESLQRVASDGRSMVVTRANTISVGAGDRTDSDGLLAVDLDGLGVLGFLPVADRGTYYSDSGNLTALGWLDDDTVLAEVRPRAGSATTWLITWDVETGDLARAASYPTGLDVAIAVDALADP